ncbi:ABC transporter ATP-binding protein [Actinomycetaceae bacterium MB13-C1-2]|nr:ABC transporter ATP-binding protein [Actinomycetaceae bacterium MB13-C1-2]
MHRNPQAPQVVSALDSVSKLYGQGDTAVTALDNVTIGFRSGEFTTIMGPSGSGKSTLLNALAGLDSVTSGEVELEGVILGSLSDDKLTRLRRDRIGFVFQSFNLIPTLDARDNILLPSRLAGTKTDEKLFEMVVETLGLRDRLHHLPSQLSGGQQQRVALARALATGPAVVVADEPTGNLDSASTQEVLGLLRSAVDELGQTVIMVTHDRHVAEKSDRVVVMRDGKVSADLWKPTSEHIEQVA